MAVSSDDARGSRPRLLFVSPRFLFPLDQGGKIRSANTLRGMKGGAFDITLASPVPDGWQRHQSDIDRVCDRFLHWPERAASRAGRLLAMASRLPVAAATDRSAAGSRCVRAALAERPDVVVVDFPHAGVLVPPNIDAATVMFTHNVEAEIFERHATRSQGLWKLVWGDQFRKMARFEGEVLRRFDSVVAVSARDAVALRDRYALDTVSAIDTGVDLDFFGFNPPPPPPPADGGTLVFVATMSWAANVEGVHVLLDDIWPLLTRQRPALRAVVIGRNPPEALVSKIRERGLNVTLTGYVDDIRPHVAQGDVYVIPLWVGSGTRIKAFEAMAMGRPVVSTTVGVEGLDVTHGEHVLCADDARDFADAILSLLADPGRGAALAANARALLERQYGWSVVARQFEAICLDALHRRQGTGGETPAGARSA